jgi:hypothetical protein
MNKTVFALGVVFLVLAVVFLGVSRLPTPPAPEQQPTPPVTIIPLSEIVQNPEKYLNSSQSWRGELTTTGLFELGNQTVYSHWIGLMYLPGIPGLPGIGDFKYVPVTSQYTVYEIKDGNTTMPIISELESNRTLNQYVGKSIVVGIYVDTIELENGSNMYILKIGTHCYFGTEGHSDGCQPDITPT